MNNHLNFIEEAIREERANRTVDQTARQRFLFARAAFTLKEPAGDLTCGIGLFNVVNGQREKVLAGLGFFLGNNGGQNNRIVHLANHGAGGLTGDFTGGEGHVMVAEAERLAHFIKHRHFVSSLSKGKKTCFRYAAV